MQDLNHYFTTATSSKDNSGDPESDSEVLAPTSPKKLCTSTTFQPEQEQRNTKSHPVSNKRYYKKANGKENFLGWNMMISKVLSARFVRNGGGHLRQLVELRLQSLSTIGRRL